MGMVTLKARPIRLLKYRLMEVRVPWIWHIISDTSQPTMPRGRHFVTDSIHVVAVYEFDPSVLLPAGVGVFVVFIVFVSELIFAY